jgi:hypothetical protein
MKRIVALFALFVAITPGQERLVSAGLIKADVIAIGILYRDFTFPWIDGWNERGHIRVERVLKGNIGKAPNLQFAWERDFRQGWCLTRPDWRDVVGKRGIWVLLKDGNQYRAHDPLFGHLDPGKHLDELLKLLEEGGR